MLPEPAPAPGEPSSAPRQPAPAPSEPSTAQLRPAPAAGEPFPGSPAASPDRHVRVLMLGMGWFPTTLGGLNRYYRSLFEQLPEARGVVVGPAEDAPQSINVVDERGTPLARRLVDFWLATRRSVGGVELTDAHLALYAAVPLLLGTLRGRPLVFHFHGPWAQENVAAGDGSRVNHHLRAAVERLVLRRADAHVVLSSAFRRELIERYRVRPWDVHVWSPGVALELFTPGDRSQARARLGIDGQAFVAVCVRRLVPRMGLDVLLDAWELIREVLPAGSALLLAGDGPLRDALAARADRAPASGGVRLLGRLSEQELIEAYRAADVAVVPSVSLEGFGLVVPEAAACGTPSIVSDIGGLPEVTMPLDRSLVVAAGDAAALGGRIEAAARGELPTRAATRRFAERFSWPLLAELHRGLYRRLLAGERDPRLRVVYLDHVARLSGAEIQLLRLLTHLRDVNPHVILGEDGPLAERMVQAGVSVEILPIAASARDLRRDVVRPGGAPPLAALHTLTYVARLALRLRALRPDLVHTNSLKAGVYGSLAARAAGIPVVWHVRDRIAEDYIPRAAVRLVRVLIRHLTDGVIANSMATLETLPADVRGEMSWVIPASVDPPAHLREPCSPVAPSSTSPPNSHAITFGMLGRIAPWKGQDLFLRAFAEAFSQGQERALLVGAAMFGEESYERDLHALAARLGIADRVEFRGFREDVWPELASMDVLVHASVIPEPFGTVVLEGMAAGLAVIAPDEGGPASVIVDGETGRLFRGRELDSLSAAMRALRDDPGERERLGTAARGTVADYHPEVLARRLEQVYEDVIAGLGARGGDRVAVG
jgi:glycosyltransferase involved in cell wall biosynthesis